MHIVITPDERELLEVLKQSLSGVERPLSLDFYTLLETYGINENDALTEHFENLLLGDLAHINSLLKQNNAINIESLIYILNQYLTSMSIILANDFETSIQNQYALNDLRKLTFCVIGLYTNQDKDLYQLPTASIYEANQLLPHAAFTDMSNSILETDEDIVIVAIHFDLGSYSCENLPILTHLISAKLCNVVRPIDRVSLLKSHH